MITKDVNYVRTPTKAKELTRDELLKECTRLQNLENIFGDRDDIAADEYAAQRMVLEKVLLNHMANDKIVLRGYDDKADNARFPFISR